MYVPLSDREFLWNQLVDTVDDYFDIEREERVRLVGGVLTEGQLDTFPQPGATLLEPWRKDSSRRLRTPLCDVAVHSAAGGRARQTPGRRRLPGGSGGVQGTGGRRASPSSRRSTSKRCVTTRRCSGRGRIRKADRSTRGWIPMGRDTMLEQRMLADLRGRLGVAQCQV